MKSLRQLLLSIVIILPLSLFAQSKCDTNQSFYKNIIAANSTDIICLSKNSPKEKTLFFTFGIWCSPCRLHLPNAIKLSKEYNLDFYVLLMEKENNEKAERAITYLRNIDSTIKILILKDEAGLTSGKKYIKFLSEITPTQFENIDDMSKYIILNKQGEVIMVTNWKDNRKNNWRDDSKMIRDRIVPVLK